MNIEETKTTASAQTLMKMKWSEDNRYTYIQGIKWDY